MPGRDQRGVVRRTDGCLRTGAGAAGVASVVWAGDARDGVNGGGDYVRFISNDDQARRSAAFFAAHCDRVRVTPMLDGVPCSIHAMVLPDGVLVLRPVELFNLRNDAAGTFFYGGMGTTWDPPAADADVDARARCRRRNASPATHGLRGAFGLDGVLTADGFRVTEMNPRFSGGLTRLANAAPDLHLDLLQLNALIGRDVGRPADDIEAEALATLDEHRIVDAMGLSSAVLETTKTTYQRVREGARLDSSPPPTTTSPSAPYCAVAPRWALRPAHRRRSQSSSRDSGVRRSRCRCSSSPTACGTPDSAPRPCHPTSVTTSLG